MTSTAIEIKLRRARDRMQEAVSVGEAWSRQDPVWIEETEEPDGSLAFRIRFKSQPPEELGAILGDAIHCARAALDHLAWDFVDRAGTDVSAHDQGVSRARDDDQR